MHACVWHVLMSLLFLLTHVLLMVGRLAYINDTSAALLRLTWTDLDQSLYFLVQDGLVECPG